MVLLVLFLSILLAWAVCAAVCMGVGELVLRGISEQARCLDSFWVGLGAIVGILETYHLFRRIDGLIAMAILAAGLAGLFSRQFFRLLGARILEGIHTSGYWIITCYLAALALVALRASGPCTQYDTGLYGAPAVRWLVTHPAVPGLVNLHGRLGFNSAVLVCTAALHQGILAYFLSYRVFTGLLTAVVLAFMLVPCVRLLRNQSNSPQDWFMALLLIPVGEWIFRGGVIGTNTDLPATAAALLGTFKLFQGLERAVPPAEEGETARAELFSAMILFSIAATFKLSTIVLAGLGWLIAFVRLLSLAKSPHERKFVTWVLPLLCAVIVVPWVCHGIILTGYPFYPAPLFRIPVDWRLPESSAALVAAGIRSFARTPFFWGKDPYQASLESTRGFHWVVTWFADVCRNRGDFLVPGLMAALGGMYVLFGSLRKVGLFKRGLLVLIPLTGNLVFWFLGAPDPRFGQAAIWGMAAALGAYGISAAIAELDSPRRMTWLAIAMIAVSTAWCLAPRNLPESLFRPLAGRLRYSQLPAPDVKLCRTPSGIEVYVPRTGDLCWDAPLPCSPYLNKTLRLRQPPNLRWGFSSQGLPDNAEWIRSGRSSGPERQP